MIKATIMFGVVSMELGGNAPFIIFDDAEISPAVDAVIASKFRNAGQTCISANRVLVQVSRLVILHLLSVLNRVCAVQAGIYDEFSRTLAERVAKMRVGNGVQPDVNVGPVINEAALEKVERHVKDAIGKGKLCTVREFERHDLSTALSGDRLQVARC